MTTAAQAVLCSDGVRRFRSKLILLHLSILPLILLFGLVLTINAAPISQQHNESSEHDLIKKFESISNNLSQNADFNKNLFDNVTAKTLSKYFESTDDAINGSNVFDSNKIIAEIFSKYFESTVALNGSAHHIVSGILDNFLNNWQNLSMRVKTDDATSSSSSPISPTKTIYEDKILYENDNKFDGGVVEIIDNFLTNWNFSIGVTTSPNATSSSTSSKEDNNDIDEYDLNKKFDGDVEIIDINRKNNENNDDDDLELKIELRTNETTVLNKTIGQTNGGLTRINYSTAYPRTLQFLRYFNEDFAYMTNGNEINPVLAFTVVFASVVIFLLLIAYSVIFCISLSSIIFNLLFRTKVKQYVKM